MAQIKSTDDLRKSFYEATLAPKKAEIIIKDLESTPNKSPIYLCYLGASEAVFAQANWNPFVKIKLVKTALTKINKAVSQDSGNVEIHFLRFATEHHIPLFLNMNPHFETDIKVILDNSRAFDSQSISKEMWFYILGFMLDSNRLTSEQELKIRSLQSYSKS